MKLVSPSQVLSIVTGLAVAMTGIVSIQSATLAATSTVATPSISTPAPTKIAKKKMAPKKKSGSMMNKSGGMMKK
jgi:hypothetical protein